MWRVVMDVLRATNITYAHFRAANLEITPEAAGRAAETFRTRQVELIVSIGGGSIT